MIEEPSETTIGIELASDVTGQVPFDAFADVVSSFKQLVDQLQGALGETGVTWNISQLRVGSALVAMEPTHDMLADIGARRIVRALSSIGASIADGDIDEIPYDAAIRATCHKMVSAMGRVPKLSIVAGNERHDVRRDALPEYRTQRRAYGTVRGTVEGMNKHNRRNFTLYEDLHGFAVRVNLGDDLKDFELGKIWDKRVEVRGMKVTQLPSGRMSVHSVESIIEIPPAEIEFESSSGILKWPEGEVNILEAQRRVRAAYRQVSSGE